VAVQAVLLVLQRLQQVDLAAVVQAVQAVVLKLVRLETHPQRPLRKETMAEMVMETLTTRMRAAVVVQMP
jgi:hypothetical protein